MVHFSTGRPFNNGALSDRHRQAAGLNLTVDSAGTGDWHLGELADRRAREVGIARGCRMDMRARVVRPRDFADFELIVAMDRANMRDLLRLPGAIPSRIRLAGSFDPELPHADVPDPYYQDQSAFESIADQLERVSQGILRELR